MEKRSNQMERATAYSLTSWFTPLLALAGFALVAWAAVTTPEEVKREKELAWRWSRAEHQTFNPSPQLAAHSESTLSGKEVIAWKN